jgi:LmbE family N-acetylglucosaminyl deacetylase
MGYGFNRIITLAPHTDDVELGAGGTIARWVEEGKEIFYIAFSTAEKSVPPGFAKNILEQEVKAATEVLGIPSENLIIYKFEVRTFPNFRQNILEILVDLREKLKPELVMLPSLNDVHQDHHIIAQEGIRAFKNTTILGYEQPWNLLSFSSQAFVTLQKKHLDKKLEAISCYQSQKHRD